MKKRILALLLALLCVFSTFVLSACGEEEEGGDDTTTTNRADPITLSLCIVAESYTEEARLSIQAALNEITREEYNTNVVLYIVTKDQYKNFVAGKLGEAERNQIVNPNKDANGLPLVDEGYPALGADQFDVLWVDGYDHMLELVKAGSISKLALNEQKMISQYIDPVALAMAGMHEFATYAVPVRHVFGNYTYLLLKKDVVDHADVAFDYNSVNSLSTLAPYLTKVRELKEGGTFAADMTILQNMPASRYLKPSQALVKEGTNTSYQAVQNLLFGSTACFPTFDKQGIPHSTLTLDASTPQTLLTNTEYQDEVIYSALLEEFQMLGTGEVTDTTNCAAAFVEGDASLIEKYEAMGYYVVEYAKPIATRDTLSESMFAVSSHTVDSKRSLELISALVTNSDICNLLAYGVEEEHYEIVSEGEEDVVDFITAGEGKYVETNVYKSSGLYCGNQFLTLPNVDMTASERALAKNNWYAAADQDMAMTIDPFAFFYLDTTKGTMKSLLPEMQTLLATVEANIEGFTSFADFKVYYGDLIPDPNDPTQLIPDPDKVRAGTLEEYVAAFRKFLAEDQLAVLEANANYKTFAGTNISNSVAGQYSSWYRKTSLGSLASAAE